MATARAVDKEKLIVKGFLLLFIAAIVSWIIVSTIDFVNLADTRVHELPDYVKGMSPLSRGIFLSLTFQLAYYLIALGLFVEFLKPSIRLKWNGSKLLTLISSVFIINGLLAVISGGIRTGFRGGLYDTMFYGIGFGILFLSNFNPKATGIKIALWTRLIEVCGPIIGYTVIPAAFGYYTGGAFGHFGYGFQGMVTSFYFWNDFLVQSLSLIPVWIFLRKGGTKKFWIASFSIGAVIVGLGLAYLLPALF
ncbi:hypothetical protein HYY73_06235 [Candidatus Woesearchaeota archaeon]|nr:hypothetical protein [Candidatus Woesearchaeota archaeon]